MKAARYSDAQLTGILKQAKGGVPVSELYREPLPDRVLQSNIPRGMG